MHPSFIMSDTYTHYVKLVVFYCLIQSLEEQYLSALGGGNLNIDSFGLNT